MKQISLSILAATALLAASCSDSQFDGFEKAENGLHYRFFTKKEGDKKVEVGDGIVVRYIISKESNDSIVIDSKKVSRDGTGNAQFVLNESSFKGSFEDGLMMMSVGDSAAFVVSADSFFLKTNGEMALPQGFKPGDYLKGIFAVKEIRNKTQMEEMRKKQEAERAVQMKEMEAKEKSDIEKYLADNKITAKPTESGIYIIETKKGSGSGSPKPTDYITANYTGKLLNGEIFDSSEQHGEPLNYQLSQLIPGWIEAFSKMKKGAKATLIIPSAQAYGAQGNSRIPPFSPLVFDIELLDFKATSNTPETERH